MRDLRVVQLRFDVLAGTQGRSDELLVLFDDAREDAEALEVRDRQVDGAVVPQLLELRRVPLRRRQRVVLERVQVGASGDAARVVAELEEVDVWNCDLR